MKPLFLPSLLPSLLLFLGWAICAFGQPAFSPLLAIVAGAGGYACLFAVTTAIQSPYRRFLIGMAWFTAVNLVTLSWFISHPFLYIWIVYIGLALAIGLQGGVLCLLATKQRLSTTSGMLAMAAFWVIMEWSRLFWLVGLSFNPIGLALTAHPFSLQLASWGGVFTLSFWVLVTSFLLLALWQRQNGKAVILWLTAATLPYSLGAVQLYYHHIKAESYAGSPLHVLALQTAFPVEETIPFDSKENFRSYLTEEWRQILTLAAPYVGKPLTLTVLPEGAVPFGAYSSIYPHATVVEAFCQIFGPQAAASLPHAEPPFGSGTSEGLVSSAFWAQGLANCLNSSVIVGLEDASWDDARGEYLHYSAALHFTPLLPEAPIRYPPSERYAKRVLLPLGEYIPFEWCRSLARDYGIGGSFTHGTLPMLFQCGGIPVSPSICYEETFGNMMCEGRRLGAHLFANLTNDGWYPHSSLPYHHRDLARLRTVENGVPLVRSCNTGITTAIDSLGTTIAALEEKDGRGALYAAIPSYTYHTLYTQWGDIPIIGLSFLLCLYEALRRHLL